MAFQQVNVEGVSVVEGSEDQASECKIWIELFWLQVDTLGVVCIVFAWAVLALLSLISVGIMKTWRRAAALLLPRPSAFSYLSTEVNVTLPWRTSTLTSHGLLYATDTTFTFHTPQTIFLRSYNLTYTFKDKCFLFWFISWSSKTSQQFFLFYCLHYYFPLYFLLFNTASKTLKIRIFHKELDSI